MRQRLAKWMMGRNGMDALNRLLSVLTLIVLIVSMFVHGYAARILWSLAVLGLIVIYFRMLSRNVYRRQQENGAYLRQRYKVTSTWHGAVDRWHQRHDYRFFKCPSCRTRLRVPRARARSTSSAASAARPSNGKPEARPYVWICDRESGGPDADAEGSL